MYIERLHEDKLLLRLSTHRVGLQNLQLKDKKQVCTKAIK